MAQTENKDQKRYKAHPQRKREYNRLNSVKGLCEIEDYQKSITNYQRNRNKQYEQNQCLYN